MNGPPKNLRRPHDDRSFAGPADYKDNDGSEEWIAKKGPGLDEWEGPDPDLSPADFMDEVEAWQERQRVIREEWEADLESGRFDPGYSPEDSDGRFDWPTFLVVFGYIALAIGMILAVRWWL